MAIVPTLNEEKGLPLVLKGLKTQAVSGIIVVDGNSTDKTVEIAKRAGARVILQEGKGKGWGFRSFLKKASVDPKAYYVMLDGDNTYDPRELNKLTSLLEKYDVVAGSRRQTVKDLRSLVHITGAFLISLIGSIVYFKWHPDITTGYWAWRGSALKKFRVTATRFDLEANLFSETVRNGFSFRTVPITYSDREGKSKLHFYDGVKIVAKLLEERFK